MNLLHICSHPTLCRCSIAGENMALKIRGTGRAIRDDETATRFFDFIGVSVWDLR